jgi:Protein of unknown function (DUF664)
MTPTHAATLAIVKESFAMLRDSIDGLPDEALGWVPFEGTNSIAVLVVHSVGATRFFLKAGTGDVGSLLTYRQTERADAFKTIGATVAGLCDQMAAFEVEAARIVANGADAHLLVAVAWPDVRPPIPARTGAGSLIHAVGHLREHVGQAQLVRELWLNRSR